MFSIILGGIAIVVVCVFVYSAMAFTILATEDDEDGYLTTSFPKSAALPWFVIAIILVCLLAAFA